MLKMKIIFSRNILVLCMSAFLVAAACTQSDPTPTTEPPPIPTPILTPTVAPTPTSTPALTSTPIPTEAPEPTPTPDEDGIIWFDYEENPATISVEGSTIVFEGDIESSTYRDFLFAVRGKEDQITAIRINSPGGITDQGIMIGEWIFDHEIDVIVEELCFSSCANYIFTAGKNKIIEKDAIVGWHGSEQQDPFLAAGYGISMAELYARQFDEMKEWGETLPGEAKEDFVATLLEAEADGKEQRFLDAIGVNLYLMVYGMLPDQFDYYMNKQTEYGGWTFTIDDMAKFGVYNVTYAGDGSYPSKKALQNFPVAVFEVPDETVPPAEIPTPIPTPTPPPGSTPTPSSTSKHVDETDPWFGTESATVVVDDDKIVIDGYIDQATYAGFLEAIRLNEDKIKTVHITSDFGDIGIATLIGTWIHENEIDVIIDEACFEVCANYIFTAGKNKIIEDGALVAWFGSPQEEEYAARALGMTIEERNLRDIERGTLGVDPSLDEQGQKDYVDMIANYIRDAIQQEHRFLETTGINDDALIYGFIGVDYEDYGLPMHLFEGWTFSVEDMAKLGIENVTYNGDGSYPDREAAFRRNVDIFRVGETPNQLATK